MVVLNAKMISFTSPSATRRTRLSIRKSLGPIPSIGEMIPPNTWYATELPGILYRHHLLDILYHANQGMVTAGVGANRANLIITYIMADLAVLHVSTEGNQGRGEVFRIADVPAQHIKR